MTSSEQSDSECCPTCGLPKDLARVLRDPGIVVAQDGAVFDLIANWANAPSDTASGGSSS